MAKPFRIFLGVLTALLLLMIAAAGSVSLLLDEDTLRTHLRAAASDATGRALDVGRIRLSVFPWLRVRLGDLRLENAQGYGPAPFAEAREVAVGIKLLPLILEKRLEVGAVEIEGLQIHLERRGVDANNWSDLFEHAEQESAAASDTEPERGQESEFQLQELRVAGLALRHSGLRYVDGASGQAYLLRDVNLDTDPITPDQPFGLRVSLNAQAPDRGLASKSKLTASLTPKLKERRLLIDALDLGFDATAKGLDLAAQLRGGGAVDVAQRLLVLDALRLEAKASGAAVPQETQQLSAEGALRYDWASGNLQARPIKLEAAGLVATVALDSRPLPDGTRSLSAALRTERFDPQLLLRALGRPALRTQDPKALHALEFSTRIEGSAQGLALRDIDARLDDSRIGGQLGMSGPQHERIDFALDIDHLDLDRYLPPDDEGAQRADRKGKERAVDAIALPYALLAPLALDGSLAVEELRFDRLGFQKARLRVVGQPQLPKRLQISSRLYGGGMELEAALPPSAAQPLYLKGKAQNVNVAGLLRDYAGQAKLRGRGSLDLDVAASGATVGALKRSAQGRLAFGFQDGAVVGFNLAESLRQAQAALRGQPYVETAARETDFSSMRLSAQLADGVLHSSDLDARGPALRVSGEGSADLIHETLDYLAKPSVVESSQGQGGRDLEALKGLTIPVRISGSFDAPKVRIEMPDALRQKASERLREELKDKDLGKKVDRELNRALDKLLGGKKKKEKAPATDSDSGQGGSDAGKQPDGGTRR